MSTVAVVVGSAGRALGSAAGPRALPLPATSAYSSFCLMCASWYFGSHVEHCEKCKSPIFRWVLTDDLRHMHIRTSMRGYY